eukprot:7428365-Pyramimonas_sp.AAC.1
MECVNSFVTTNIAHLRLHSAFCTLQIAPPPPPSATSKGSGFIGKWFRRVLDWQRHLDRPGNGLSWAAKLRRH